MALKLFGDKPKAAGASALDMPTTQVRMGKNTPAGYDPLATVSIMDQLRSAGTQAASARKLPLIGNLPVVKQFQVLLTLLVVFALLALLMLYLDQRTTSQASSATATITDMQMLSQRLARGAALAAQGQKAAFETVEDSRKRFGVDLAALTDGGEVRGNAVEAVGGGPAGDILTEIRQRWDGVDKAAARVVQNQDALTTLAASLEKVNDTNSALLELSQQLGLQIAQGGGSVKDVDNANQLAVLSQRIAKNANTLASGEEIDPETAFLLGKDTGTFRDVLNGLVKGSDALKIAPLRGEDARATLGELAKRFTVYDQSVSAILASMQKLTVAKKSAREVTAASEDLLTRTMQLGDNYEGGGRMHVFTLVAAIVFGLLALAALVALGVVFLRDARSRASESENENKRNQEAILRLLNEMGNLADGDLTVQASVTEDVTGAIADSINFTIEELRTLVRGINSATDQVTKATQETQAISNRLYEASQRQNREIQQASASVLQMAQSISEVAQNASQSAKVAQLQLSAAEKGGQAVQNQIAGMNEIRSQIQDTSKRIKRLGESSLEIGEIVELISDITEQTNVLALNAAIQAASAGEAGRGFTVVAEEVQRLAERSGEATKQIEAIVKTIQADTQDAVAAMEKSTVGVVEGTKLSDAAGQALTEIQKVSRDLADLISRISSQTQMQSTSVTEVTRGMQGILKITEETTEGTKQTNVSIGQLTRLAAELRSSVAGFKV